MVDEELSPLQVADRTWLWCYGPGWSRERVTKQPGWDRSGKWLIFLDREEVESAWRRIQRATMAGKLGFRSKVSTAKPTRFEHADFVIAVYNEDADDQDEAIRIRKKLRKMGFGVAEQLFYKREATTQAGIYHGSGQRAMSMIL